MLSYESHCSQELVETLFVPPEVRGFRSLLRPLLIVGETGWACGGFHLHGFVLATSHAVLLRRGAFLFAQVLACAPLRLASPPPLLERGLGPDPYTNTLEGVKVVSQLWTSTLQEGEEQFAALPGRGVLKTRFPGTPTPITVLKSSALDPGGVRLYSLHTYPHEGRSVVSSLELLPGGRPPAAEPTEFS